MSFLLEGFPMQTLAFFANFEGQLCINICQCRLNIQQQQHQESTSQSAATSSENHIQIQIVSDKFAGLSDAERQSVIEQVDQTAVCDSKQVAAVQTCQFAHL